MGSSNGPGVFYLHRVPTGLPTSRPYGTPENTGIVVFYPHSVPTGLPTSRPYGTPENTGVVCFLPTFRSYGSTHIASLWDSGKHGGCLFFTYIASLRDYPHSVPTGLPTFRPYGTPENNGSDVFYLPRVPTGLRETPRVLFSTHLASLRDYGKHRPRCFLPTLNLASTDGLNA